MRRVHLFLALFLTPWVLLYALSTMAMQHRQHLTGQEKRVAPPYDVVQEMPYTPGFPAGTTSAQAAEAILKKVGLEGAHRVKGDWTKGKLVVERDRPVNSYRVTYLADPGKLTVERQQFKLIYFLEMLHRRRGFEQPFWFNDAWAVTVDLVIVAILLWALTGLYMWWETKPTRKAGVVCLVGSFAIFGLLVSLF